MHNTRDIVLPQASVSCSTTVYVAVTNMHGGMPYFMLGSSTNSRDFRRFLEEMLWSRQDDMNSEFYLILDGE